MKTRYKVFGISLFFGLMVWIIDAAIDSQFFSKGDFPESLLLSITNHEIYMRIMFTIFLLIFAGIISYVLEKRDQTLLMLRESEENYKNIYKNAQVGLIRTSLADGTVIECNEKIARMFGYDDIDDLKKNFVAAEHYLTSDAREKMLESLREKGEITSRIEQFRKKDGSIVWTNISVRINKNREWIEGVVEDVTEQMKAQLKIKESEEKYRRLFNSGNDAIFVYQPTSSTMADKFIEINDTACERLGYTKDEMLTKSVREISKIDSEKAEKYLEVLFANQYAVIESVHLTKDGREIPVEINSRLFELNGVPTIMSIARDISERKYIWQNLQWELEVNKIMAQTSEALIDPEVKLENVAALIVENAQRITKSKHGYVSIFDQITKENVTRTLTIMSNDQCIVKGACNKNNFPIGEDGKFGAYWKHSLKTKKGYYSNSSQGQTKFNKLPAGHVPIINFLTVPAIIGDRILGQISLANSAADYNDAQLKAIKELAHLFALSIQHKRIEDEILKLNIELEAKVLSRTKQYKNALDVLQSEIEGRIEIEKRLRESNAAKDIFFSIIGHDLKNPLQVLLTSAELLRTNFERGRLDKIEKHILRLNESSYRLKELLENLLTWALSQSGRIKHEPEVIDIGRLLEKGFEFCKEFAEKKEIDLTGRTSENVFAFADRNMIETVMRNLAFNAIKFTPKGGKIRFDYKKKENFIELSVRDTGIGISKEDQEKLFRIDVHHTTLGTSCERGTGLGLIISKDFVEKNGGQLTIESQLGIGSTFSFTLPRAD